MKTIIKKVLIFAGLGIGLCLLCVVVFICYALVEESRFDKRVAKCKTIQVGMSREDVIAMFGKDVVDEYKGNEPGTSVLGIDSPFWDEWGPSVTIRKETGKVEKVNCSPPGR